MGIYMNDGKEERRIRNLAMKIQVLVEWNPSIEERLSWQSDEISADSQEQQRTVHSQYQASCSGDKYRTSEGIDDSEFIVVCLLEPSIDEYSCMQSPKAKLEDPESRWFVDYVC